MFAFREGTKEPSAYAHLYCFAKKIGAIENPKTTEERDREDIARRMRNTFDNSEREMNRLRYERPVDREEQSGYIGTQYSSHTPLNMRFGSPVVPPSYGARRPSSRRW